MGSVKEILLNLPRSVRRPDGGDWAAAANFDIFTIANACVRVTSIFGHVTAAATGANATPLLSFTPTGGGALTNICTVALAAAWPINSVLMWDGLLATVLVATIGIGHGATGVETFAGGLTFVPGVIRITNAGANDATLAVDWYITYIAMDVTATVVAA